MHHEIPPSISGQTQTIHTIQVFNLHYIQVFGMWEESGEKPLRDMATASPNLTFVLSSETNYRV